MLEELFVLVTKNVKSGHRAVLDHNLNQDGWEGLKVEVDRPGLKVLKVRQKAIHRGVASRCAKCSKIAKGKVAKHARTG